MSFSLYLKPPKINFCKRINIDPSDAPEKFDQTLPLVLIYDNQDQTTFLINNFINNNDVTAHINFDLQKNPAVLSVFLDICSFTGYNLPPDEFSLLKSLGGGTYLIQKQMYGNLNRIIFGNHIRLSNSMFTDFMDGREKTGYLPLALGFYDFKINEFRTNWILPWSEEFKTTSFNAFQNKIEEIIKPGLTN